MAVFLAPEGSSLSYTNRYANEVEDILKSVPESDKYFVISGSPTVNKGIAFFRPYEWESRNRSIQQISASIQPELFSIPGVRSFPILPPWETFRLNYALPDLDQSPRLLEIELKQTHLN